MKCLKCDHSHFVVKKKRCTQEFRDETIEVMAEATVCSKCRESYFTDDQMDVLRRLTVDQYRTMHGLLTSCEILTMRESLGMTQVQFASYLNVGIASIQRWETYFVQEPGQDEHLRLK